MNNRLSKLKHEFQKQNIDAVLVSSVPNITYLTGFSGFSTEEREVFLLITQDKNYVITDKRYIDELREHIKNVILANEVRPESDSGVIKLSLTPQNDKSRFVLEEVSSSIPFRIALEKLAKRHKIKKLGIEENNVNVSEYKSLKRCFNDLNHFSIDSIRVIKEDKEIHAIEKACQLTDKTFEYILTKIKPGVTEKELAFETEFFIKKHGGDLAFPSIVAFGKNSAVPHHKTYSVIPNLIGNPRSLDSRFPPKGTSSPRRAARGNDNIEVGNDKKRDGLKAKDIILLDFGAKVDNYCSDMTRVVFLGKATDKQKKVYETVLEAQKQAIEFLDKETPCARSLLVTKNINQVAHDYIRSKGFGENIFHSLGHGVGLEIHEAPRLSPKSKEVLKPGMVFTIEPGIYLPGNFGIRIEDLAVLENSRLRLLSKSPKNLIEL